MWISMIGQLVIYKESCLLILPHVTSFFLGGGEWGRPHHMPVANMTKKGKLTMSNSMTDIHCKHKYVKVQDIHDKYVIQ